MRKFLLLALVFILCSYLSFSQGTVRGKVTDENGETLIGVTVVLKSNRSVGTSTDFDGNYSFKIPDSTPQTLIVSYISYKTIEEVLHPVKGEVVIKNFVMSSSAQAINEVEITAKAVRAKDYYMENIKRKSATTIDYVSSETMKKTGDANVTAAVARVSGVSTNGSFITVRGIGDRYVKTSINGSVIPTLDPFTNNIKLDLFPASLVDNILITKTASPDLPGDWAGAFLSVETKDYPEQLAVNLETSFGYNNQTSFKDIVSSQRSTTDWLGYDNSFRDYDHNQFAPAIIEPTTYQEFVALGLGGFYNSMGVTEETTWNDTYYKLGLVELGLLSPALFDDAAAFASAKNNYENGNYKHDAFKVINNDAATSGKLFSNSWNTLTRTTPLNFSQSLSIGNQTKLFGRPLGFLFGFRYGSSVQYDPNSTSNRASVDANGNDFVASANTQQFSKETNGWSALANVACKLTDNHSVSFLFMPNFTGVNNVRNAAGIDGQSSADETYLLVKNQFYEERKQIVYQFKSEHYIPKFKLKAELKASYTNGKSDVPDFKELKYLQNADGSYQIGGGLAINRFFRYLSEDLFDSHLSFELPIDRNPDLARKIKFGAAYQNNDRKYDQYDYALKFSPRANSILVDGNIDAFFSLNNFDISTGTFNGMTYSTINQYYFESNNPSNHTIGTTDIQSVFVMLDYGIVPSLRLSGGLRVEKAKLFTDVFKYDSLGLATNDPRRKNPYDLFIVNPARLKEETYLPSVNLIYKLRDSESAPINLRFNYSQSVARPSLRELSDVVIFDYENRVNIFGNSGLKSVNIYNYDLRLESYFKSSDNLSLSLFYKDFKNHIELTRSNQGYSWQNVDQSFVMGLELEGRKTITKKIEFRANVSFVQSQTKFVQFDLLIDNGVKTRIPADTVSRAMFGQAPYVLNGALSYTADSIGLVLTLGYNIQGPRLVLTTADKSPDVFELPRHLFDFKVSKKLGKHFNVSLTVKDILNQPIRRSYNYDEGWTLDYDRYTYGTNFILSLAYKL